MFGVEIVYNIISSSECYIDLRVSTYTTSENGVNPCHWNFLPSEFYIFLNGHLLQLLVVLEDVYKPFHEPLPLFSIQSIVLDD